MANIRISKETHAKLRAISTLTMDEIINILIDAYTISNQNKVSIYQESKEVFTTPFKSTNNTNVELSQSTIDEINEYYKSLGYVSNVDQVIEDTIKRAKEKLKKV